MSGNTWSIVNDSIFFGSILSDVTGQNLIGAGVSIPYNGTDVFKIYKSTNYGSTWSSPIYIDVDNQNYRISNITSDSTLQNIYVAGCLLDGDSPTASYLYKSTNGGSSFSQITNAPSSIWLSVTSNSTGQYIVAGQSINNGANGELWYTTDSGATWNQSTCDGNYTATWSYLASSADGQYVIAGTFDNATNTSKIYTSSNYGANFTDRGVVSYNSESFYINQLKCDSTGQYVFITTTTSDDSKSYIFKSSDYGVSFIPVFTDNSAGQYYWDLSCDSTGQYLLVTDFGNNTCYYSEDSGATWTLQTTVGSNTAGLPGSLIPKISPNHSNLYFSTGGNGLYKSQPSLVCFKEGSLILTENDYQPIENLKKGDLVKTLKNGFVPIHSIGKKTIFNRGRIEGGEQERIKDQLYKCTSKGFSEVFEDLIITGCHSILIDHFITYDQKEETIKVNGDAFVTDGKFRLPACVDRRTEIYEGSGDFTIYHLALENDDYYMNYGIWANGLLVETCSKRYLNELSGMTLI